MEWSEPFDFPTGISGFPHVNGKYPGSPENGFANIKIIIIITLIVKSSKGFS